MEKYSKYRLVLSEFGKLIFKGGNIEVMQPNLKEYKTLREIQLQFLKIGTSQEYNYIIEGYIQGRWERIRR